MDKYLGTGMVFYTEKENYDKMTENIKKIYPNAKVEIVPDDIEFPAFSLEEQLMLGLIEDQDNIKMSYTTDIEKNNSKTNELKNDSLVALVA